MEEVYVADLGSSNGTMVDGKRITQAVMLPAGSRLQVGGHLLEHEFRSRKEVEASKELDRDLESARRYVHSLIPAPLTEGPIRTEWVLLPSARLGGDVFGYHQLDARTFAIFLLDVSGHGTGAAMHAVSVTNVLQRDAVPGLDMRDPAKVATHVNAMFQMSTHGGLYLTLWYGVYDLETRTLAYCSAGHHPSYLVAQARERAIPLKTGNIMIGATSPFEFESSSVEGAGRKPALRVQRWHLRDRGRRTASSGASISPSADRGASGPGNDRAGAAAAGHSPSRQAPGFRGRLYGFGRDVSLVGPHDAPAQHQAVASVDALVLDGVGEPAHEGHSQARPPCAPRACR
jgi:hypothetical protein